MKFEAGAGVYSKICVLAAPAGKTATKFNGEVRAILLAMKKVTENLTEIDKVVDSPAAISSITSYEL